ncbi:MAG: cellulose biosynthesis protein BcsN [Alsobacter sp.]
MAILHRTVWTLLAALALVGCTILPETTSGIIVPPRRPAPWAALPPEAGEVLSVVERDDPDIRTQRIVLAGQSSQAGENMIQISRPGLDSPRATLFAPPTQATIEDELADVFPGMVMTIDGAMRTNGYGAYGLATGRRKGESCVYTWQWLDRFATSEARLSVLLKSDPASIRVRLCGRMPPEQLAAIAARLWLPVPGRSGLIPPPDLGGRDLISRSRMAPSPDSTSSLRPSKMTVRSEPQLAEPLPERMPHLRPSIVPTEPRPLPTGSPRIPLPTGQ